MKLKNAVYLSEFNFVVLTWDKYIQFLDGVGGTVVGENPDLYRIETGEDACKVCRGTGFLPCCVMLQSCWACAGTGCAPMDNETKRKGSALTG